MAYANRIRFAVIIKTESNLMPYQNVEEELNKAPKEQAPLQDILTKLEHKPYSECSVEEIDTHIEEMVSSWDD